MITIICSPYKYDIISGEQQCTISLDFANEYGYAAAGFQLASAQADKMVKATFGLLVGLSTHEMHLISSLIESGLIHTRAKNWLAATKRHPALVTALVGQGSLANVKKWVWNFEQEPKSMLPAEFATYLVQGITWDTRDDANNAALNAAILALRDGWDPK
jgi:hypothetical protein